MELKECIESGKPFLRDTGEEERGLIVFIHGFEKQPEDHAGFITALAESEKFVKNDILPFKYQANRWSNRDPQEIAEGLAAEIDYLWKERQPKRLFLVAHSMGGLIVRAAIIYGLRKEWRWASAITRLCLLESTNRGYRPRRLWHKFLLVVARLLRKARLARSMLVGSSFVVRVRLDWLDLFAGGERTAPETVQLLGDRGSRPVVLEDDSNDLLTCGNTEQRMVPKVNHHTIAMMAPDEIKEGTSHVDLHYIEDALLDQLNPDGVKDVTVNEDVKLVVLAVHGIRDYGKWLDKLEKEIEKIAPTAKVWQQRYPYFSILSFLLPGARMKRVHRLVRDYGDFRVLYPKAQFVCAGHSNGTYLLGRAMLDFEALRFERVYLAGSVLPREFNWRAIGVRNQIKGLRNDMASADFPVGLLCEALRVFPLYDDLGAGGFRGFTNVYAGTAYDKTEWVEGDHGAALEEQRLPNVANYLVTGKPTRADDPVDKESKALAWLAKGAHIIGIVLLPTLVGIGWLIFMIPGLAVSWIVFVFYLVLLYFILVRF